MLIRTLGLGLVFVMAALPAFADEPDGLRLPPGFHASVVAEGLGDSVRHMAFGDANRLYISTERQAKDAPNAGIIALHLNGSHVADKTEHFSQIDNGTAIAIRKGALYTSSEDTLYRFALKPGELVPSASPEVIVSGLPGRVAIAFDDRNNLFLAAGARGNVCAPPGTPRDQKSVGPRPCPVLETRAGVWRFDADRPNQSWASGEHYATGIRDTNALAFGQGALYAVLYGRDEAEKAYPEIITPEAGAHISDEMFKVEKGTDMGWPYTHYDSARKVRLAAPEYGGDGKTPVTDAKYAVPVVAFPAHVAPMDIAFYNGRMFPQAYRGGAFIAFHGAGGGDPRGHDDGYNVMFVPFGKDGAAHLPMAFAQDFAGPTRNDRNGKRARYRPVGVTVGPDGALYVSDSQKGRIWRITYRAP
jgi:glucose/arabinose dehydrogenase